jgi:hypothetical protein
MKGENMEKITVTIYGEGRAVYDQVPAWIQVDSLTTWGGHLLAAQGHQIFSASGRGSHRAPF